MRRTIAGAALLVASCLFPALAPAAGVRISPVVIEMPNARQPGVVQLTNESDIPRTFQGQGLRWTQAGNQDVYEDTDDLVVVPPIAEIAPGATQVFRVMLRQPAPATTERTYRVVLEDITPAERSATAIALRYAHNLPLLIAPVASPTAVVRWSECGVPAPAPAARTPTPVCVRVTNAGNRRVKLQKIMVAGKDWQQVIDLGTGINLLAGTSWQWTVPRASATALERVTVEAVDQQPVLVQPGGR